MKFITTNDLNEICFKDDSINIIADEDVLISDEIYAMFFEQQSTGKQFKIKNLKGSTFEEIFEEYQPTYEDLNEQPISETDELKQRIAKLEAMVETLLKDKQS
jgi:hypothetical protein